jgi:hypothetical protein
MARMVLEKLDDITRDWLQAAIRCDGIADFEAHPIGTGQLSENHRIAIGYEEGAQGPPSVVAKLASTDATSRATGVSMGIYEREVHFYQDLQPRIRGPLAEPFLAEYDADSGAFTIVLRDIADATQGDQIAGCTVDVAARALAALARMQAPLFGDRRLAATPWLNQPTPLNETLLCALLQGFEERYADELDPEHLTLCERFVASAERWLAERDLTRGLCHGDFRLDNLLFAADAITVVDWQTVAWGPLMMDASYFLGGSLTVASRRAHEEA